MSNLCDGELLRDVAGIPMGEGGDFTPVTMIYNDWRGFLGTCTAVQYDTARSYEQYNQFNCYFHQTTTLHGKHSCLHGIGYFEKDGNNFKCVCGDACNYYVGIRYQSTYPEDYCTTNAGG